ncbi:peroxidase 5 [Citrus sinensis]|nr:peroxidase 5 [Citrus sinensis]KAH9658747.1 peroxidase 5 [Citrus sinensis]
MASLSQIIFVSILLLIISTQCEAQLSPTFYDATCPRALKTIRTGIRNAVSGERCDASILLDDSSSIDSEKNALPNFKSVRGFEVIDSVKSQLESVCPGVVSCADIVAVAARDASFAVGGPSWTVKLGRRDSTTASRSLAENLPSFTDGLDKLISTFATKGFSARDLVALSGAHTIGQAQCALFRDRIYSNQSDIDAGFASTRRRECPASGGDSNLSPLDLVTPDSFDNNYFKNLVQKKGLLASDQVLFSGGSTDSIVDEYSKNRSKFKSDFAAAMIKMADISPLTGTAGQIRRVCNLVN